MRTLVFYLTLLFFLAGLSAFGSDQAPTLKEVETLALQNSDQIKALRNNLEGAKYNVLSRESALYPKLSIEASYRQVTEVPTLILPTGQSLTFGDTANYSIGPMITWNLLDFGQTRYLIEASEEAQASKEKELLWLKRQVLLLSRITYLKALQKAEQLELTQQSLNLAESQYKDISNKSRAGVANKIDLLSASKEVSNLKLQVEQLSADYQNAVRDLSLVANDESLLTRKSELQFENARQLESSILQKQDFESASFDPANHPLIESLSKQADSLQKFAKSHKNAVLPKLNLFAKSSLDYPNGPNLEQIHQNSFGLTLSMPLFEAGKSTNESKEKYQYSLSVLNKREEKMKELASEFRKNIDQVRALRRKTRIYQQATKESREKARLVYNSYSAGKLSFLEVQTANLQLLETQIQSSFNQIQLNIHLSQLASLLEER